MLLFILWYIFKSSALFLLSIVQNSPTDLRNFDPILTCIPPTLSDLITTDRSLHVDSFDYVAPEDAKTADRYKGLPATPLNNEAIRTTTVSVHASTDSLKEKNSTDEEKAMVRNKVGSGPALTVPESAPDLTVPSVEVGQFVEGRLERSNTPYASKVVVTAEINS